MDIHQLNTTNGSIKAGFSKYSSCTSRRQRFLSWDNEAATNSHSEATVERYAQLYNDRNT